MIRLPGVALALPLILTSLTVRAQESPPSDSTGRDAATQEVVITGTLREMSRLQSAVPTEVFTPQLFRRAATTNLFDGMGMVSGVQPMLACGVCYTGDIHINGLEGPYTLVLIDGMPLVSGLATVYGLIGIPNGMIQQVELVRGPGSALYGSEALAGTINIRTLQPWRQPRWSFDLQGTSWGEVNLDATRALKFKKVDGLVSYSSYQHHARWDRNGDDFTDLPLIDRHSLFTKWSVKRPKGQTADMALRYYYEDRFGGQLDWRLGDRGGDRQYGESIFTHRLELIGAYRLPTTTDLTLSYSFTWHDQDAAYGNVPYQAQQGIAFGQLLWQQPLGERHHLLTGATFRYSYYDDNTPATASASTRGNQPARVTLPGLFGQYEWTLSERHTLLTGARWDYSSVHGSILSGRVNYKWQVGALTSLRLSTGNGFRVVNLFTEDHAALTGSREVVVSETLRPERSWNVNLNALSYLPLWGARGMLTLDASVFYTHFSNQILPDYDTNPLQIIYTNLDGTAASQGASLQVNLSYGQSLRASVGATVLDVSRSEQGERRRQPLVPLVQGTFQLSYTFVKAGLTVDYTGQAYSPMDLPVVPNDFRPSRSPAFSLQNVQLTQRIGAWQVYAAVKNLWDFVPENPILRPHDPFDRTADDPVTNPNGYRFDTTYIYAPQQGRRLVVGVRWVLE